MRTSWHLTVLLLFLVSASFASPEEDVFAGCYSLDQDNEPVLKVEIIEDTYYVSLRDYDGWAGTEDLRPGTQQELSELFDSDSTRIKSSLVADKGLFGLFHVQTGETYSGYKAETDYIAFISHGGGSVYKIDCINEWH